MTVLIESATRLEAWMAGVERLIKPRYEFDVVLSVADPTSDGQSSANARTRVNEFLASEKQFPLHTVAETIFPAVEYRKHGVKGVYSVYPDEVYPTIKRRWGTYAYRLLRRTTGEGAIINPLESMIDRMKGKDTKRSSFELGVAEGPYDLPLYDTVADRKLPLGGPCLSHLSFKKNEGRVRLTAIYRSHDYRWKVLGNLLGLARLQQFVAEQTGLKCGELVVHSTYATLTGALAPVQRLLRDLKAGGTGVQVP